MFYCDNCDSFFDEPIEEEDFVGYYGSAKAYQSISICPHCHSDSIEEAAECAWCDQPFTEGEINADGLCPICAVELEECQGCGEFFESNELLNGHCKTCMS